MIVVWIHRRGYRFLRCLAYVQSRIFDDGHRRGIRDLVDRRMMIRHSVS